LRVIRQTLDRGVVDVSIVEIVFTEGGARGDVERGLHRARGLVVMKRQSVALTVARSQCRCKLSVPSLHDLSQAGE
jgi:hypothetical protein